MAYETRIIVRAGRSIRVIDHGPEWEPRFDRWRVENEWTAEGDVVGYGSTEERAIRDYLMVSAGIMFDPAECDANHCTDPHCPYPHRHTWRIENQHFLSEEDALNHAFPGEQFAAKKEAA